jgi:hypothetical protein
MIRTALKTAMTALVAATIGTSAFIAPAQAGGSLSVHVQPRNEQENRAMRAGLSLYSIYNQVKGGASIRQIGSGNAAGVAQDGRGNQGIVHQEGRGHNGTVTQNGNGNSYGLFQFGRNTNGHATQTGNGNAGATFQFGW